MSDKLRVNESTTLLAFLQSRLSDWARNKIKQRLQTGCVSVNGVSITQHNHALNPGDLVEVLASAKATHIAPLSLDIIYQDHDLVAINKPAGLLSVGTNDETENHALAMLRSQLSRRSHAARLWPVHRIDRDTSGVLLFATSREMREAVMAKWDDTEKIYLAVVEGKPTPPSGTIDQPLRMDEAEYRVHVGAHPKAKPAKTHYRTLRNTSYHSLLEVQLATGRQHQIRAHMAWLGHPVVGDTRYGTAGPRMGLHALRLSITKPGNNKKLVFEAPPPSNFTALLT